VGIHDMTTRVSLRALMLIFAAWIFVVVHEQRRTNHESGPAALDDATEWEWVAAEPGTNLYVSRADSGALASLPSAWINRSLSSGLASVRGSVLELRQFDCQRGMSRLRLLARVYRDVNGAEAFDMAPRRSRWSPVVPGTSAEPLLYLVCRTRAPPRLATP